MDALRQAVATVPAGAWLVGVSGGADSVALLHLLSARDDLCLVVGHLDHQLRGEESDADVAFVRALSERLAVRCVVGRREEFESDPRRTGPTSASLRAIRFAFFRREIERHDLLGVILAHHADDQAETVLQRLLRGGWYTTLAGIAPGARVHGVTTLHPLLGVRRQPLRAYLNDLGEPWREDSSNRSAKYLRNRIRRVLSDRPALTQALLDVSRACATLREWVRTSAPTLRQEFSIATLDDLPAIFARHAAGKWLRESGIPPAEIDRGVTDRLRAMCADAALPARQQFPGRVTVRRRRGIISAG